MKTIVLTILLFTMPKLYSQDTINWSPYYKLKWEDFKGVPDTNSNNTAISVIGIKYKCSYTEKRINFTAFCYFNKKESWVKEHTYKLLNHEKGHFDIGEIFCRRLKKAMKLYQFNSLTFKQDIETIYASIVKENTKMDALYDKETNLSRNLENQLKWDNLIAKELLSLDEFR